MASSPRAYLLQQRAADADQVELNALRSGRAVIAGGTDDEQLVGVLDDSTGDLAPLRGGEPWQLGDLVYDDSVGPIHEELSRRASGLQDAYPFELEDSALVHDAGRRSRIYEFLLAASFSTHEGNRHAQLPRLFERELYTWLPKSRLVFDSSSATVPACRLPPTSTRLMARGGKMLG